MPVLSKTLFKNSDGVLLNGLIYSVKRPKAIVVHIPWKHGEFLAK